MDMRAYSPSVQKLREEYEALVSRSDPRALRILHKILREAKALNDDLLLGNTYHSLAFAEYFITGRYNAFLRYLRLSARHLLRCNNPAETAHINYLIALDALNKGMYDVACHQFLEASYLFEEAGEENAAAIMELSIGHIMQQLGDYSRALYHMRRSLAVIRRHPEHPHHYSNVAGLHMNEALCYLGLGKIAQAERAYRRAALFFAAHEGRFHSSTAFHFALLGARLSLATGERAALKEHFSNALALLPTLPRMTENIEELHRLGQELLMAKQTRLAGQLLHAIQEESFPVHALHGLRLFANLRVSYELTRHRSEALLAAYRFQHEIERRLLKEKQNAYRYTQDLIHLVSELRKEQDEIQQEHTNLLRLAQIDALTGIPNRDALNHALEQALEEAVQSQTPLGVCFIDVDELKAFNDAHGHPAGDRCLAEFGEMLRQLAEEEPIFAARYGGDEFVVLYRNMTGKEIRKRAKALAAASPLRISQGICNLVPKPGTRGFDFLRSADAAMYEAKNNARRNSGVGGIRLSSRLLFAGRS